MEYPANSGNLKHFLTTDRPRLRHSKPDTILPKALPGLIRVKKVPLLRGKTIVNCSLNLGPNPTTFELAAKMFCSADVLNINISTSATSKGELLTQDFT